MHGLDLAMVAGKALQRTRAEQNLAVPGRPEADVRRLQAFDVERVVASGRGGGTRSRQVMLDQAAYARIVEISGKDLHREASVEKHEI
jgi:hypothetical protein